MTRPKWYSAEDERADRAARYGTDPAPSSGPPAGMLARFNGFCWTCDRSIVAGESRVMPHGDSWVCVGCAGRGE